MEGRKHRDGHSQPSTGAKGHPRCRKDRPGSLTEPKMAVQDRAHPKATHEARQKGACNAPEACTANSDDKFKRVR
eukprot:2349633-Rhodomonas_salina.5